MNKYMNYIVVILAVSVVAVLYLFRGALLRPGVQDIITGSGGGGEGGQQSTESDASGVLNAISDSLGQLYQAVTSGFGYALGNVIPPLVQDIPGLDAESLPAFSGREVAFDPPIIVKNVSGASLEARALRGKISLEEAISGQVVGVRGKIIPVAAKSLKGDTIVGQLTTAAGGTRQIAGSEALFARLAQNIKGFIPDVSKISTGKPKRKSNPSGFSEDIREETMKQFGVSNYLDLLGPSPSTQSKSASGAKAENTNVKSSATSAKTAAASVSARTGYAVSPRGRAAAARATRGR
jgi:hypothetical protein